MVAICSTVYFFVVSVAPSVTENVKAGLAELELWCAKATTEVIYIL